MDEVTYDPRDVSTTISGQGSVPSDYDPRDNNSGILSTSFRRVSSTEHGATVPWHANQDDWGRTIPDPVPGKEAFDRINDAAVKGYQGTPFIQAPEARDFLNKSPVGRFFINPGLDAVSQALGVLHGAGGAATQTAYEVGNAVGGPRLGRDVATGLQVGGLLAPQAAGPRAGLMPPPDPPFSQGAPRSVMERMQPPPIEGQTTLGRAIDLLRHQEQWNNPDNPTLKPPMSAPPPPGFIPGGATPPPGGPVAGLPDPALVRALGPDPAAVARPVPEPPPLFTREGTPVSSAGAKQIAAQYYDIADRNGGTLTPRFTNQWLDTITKSAEQSDWGKAAAGSNPVVDLIGRLQNQRDQPMTLAAAQEVDQAIGKQISRQYGPGGSMKDAADLLDIQHKLRDQIDGANESDVTGGKAGFDALAPARKAWSQSMKMDDMERMKERADMTTNPTTAFQTQVKNFVTSRTKSRGWSDDEISALKDAADRGVIGGGLHLLGSRLVPYLTAGIAGGATGGLSGVFAAAPGWAAGQAVSAGARSLANTMAARRVANAMDVLNRSVPSPPQ